MLFPSITFLYYFLPVTFLLYYIAPVKKSASDGADCAPMRCRNLVLLAASFLFYFWGEPKYCLLMAATILLTYIGGLSLEKFGKSRCLLFLFTGILLSFLFWFKYLDFFISTVNQVTGKALPLYHLALPVGISFYTFQALSYLADVYTGKAHAEHDLADFAMYICLFPQLIAGPIVRYQTLRREIKMRSLSVGQILTGIKRFLTGLSKKLLLADSFGLLIETLEKSGEQSVLGLWLIAIAYTFQIYFDFSGYSDMAIGLGLMLGFHFPENFDYPYISRSITEFWRRWHMTLGGFFRDYVYIPMGGSRVSFPRWTFNMLTVWALSGLWHGAGINFLLWGLFYGMLLFLEKCGLKKMLAGIPSVFQHLYTMFFVVLGFALFRQEDLGRLSEMFLRMFGLSANSTEPVFLFSAESLYQLRSFSVLLLTGIVGSTPLPRTAVRRLTSRKWISAALSWIYYPALLLLCTAWIISGSFQAFLYFRF